MLENKFNLVFFVSAFLFEGLLLQFIILNGNGNIPLYIFIYIECFFLYLLGVYLVKKDLISFSLPGTVVRFFSKITSIPADLSIPSFIIIAGIIFRLTLFPASLTTSPDAYRYIWEGKLIINGFNPYELEPLNPRLNQLHTADLPSKINFPEKTAIYPPVSQVIFAIAAFVSPDSFLGLKLIYLIAEFITFIFLLKLLYLKQKNLNYLVIYAWLPLPVMEFFINSHLDVFGIMFLVIFIYFFEKGNYYKAAVFFSLSFLSKLFPLFLIPLFINKAGIKKSAFMILIILLLTVLAYAPFISGNVNIFNFLMLYIEKWEFNASVYYLLKLLFSGAAARLICGVILLISIGLIAYFYKDFTKAAAAVFIVFTIVAATVYPWYLGWLAVLNPVWIFSSAISLFFTVNFSNFTPMSSVWQEYNLVLLAEYIPFFLFLVYDIRKNLKRPPEIIDQK